MEEHELAELAELLLKHNLIEFDWKSVHEKSGIAIGTKFAPIYVSIFTINFDRKFLKGEKIKPCVWLRYIGDIFFM